MQAAEPLNPAQQNATGSRREWNFCPHCGRELDISWECVPCDADFYRQEWPWWRELFDELRACFERQRPVRWHRRVTGRCHRETNPMDRSP